MCCVKEVHTGFFGESREMKNTLFRSRERRQMEVMLPYAQETLVMEYCMGSVLQQFKIPEYEDRMVEIYAGSERID